MVQVQMMPAIVVNQPVTGGEIDPGLPFLGAYALAHPGDFIKLLMMAVHRRGGVHAIPPCACGRPIFAILVYVRPVASMLQGTAMCPNRAPLTRDRKSTRLNS